MERKRKKALVNQRLCAACGCCVKVCPVQAVQIVKGIMAKIDRERCAGCGKCVKECPASVISLQEAEA